MAGHSWLVLGVAGLLTLLAAWAIPQLPVHTSRQALLPRNSPVTQRMNDFLRRFGAASDLIVVLEGAPRPDLEAFADRLAERLRADPAIGQATERLDLGFLLAHAYLPMPADKLDQVATLASSLKPPDRGGGATPSLADLLSQFQAWIKVPPDAAQVQLETAEHGLAAANALLGEWQRWLTAPTMPNALDWRSLLPSLGGAALGDGYFASRDGRMLFVFVHPRQPVLEFEQLAPFVAAIQRVAADLSAEVRASGATAPKLAMTGLPAIEYEERIAIERDITWIIGSAIVLISLLILLVARSLRWAVIIFVPMALGVVWSLGLVLVTVGHLTIITASFMAILFGLGADYGIFTSSRIAEERRAGKSLHEAIGRGIGASFPAVLTAGGASLVIFGALATVDFPGFSELGLVAAKGVLLILVSTWTVQPALYALLPPRLGDAGQDAKASGARLSGALPRRIALAIVAVAIVAAAIGGWRGMELGFNYDVLALLPKNSDAATYQRRMVAESDYQAEVVVFTAKDLAEARRINDAASKLPSIAAVRSLTDLFPADSEARLAKAQAIAAQVGQAGLATRVDGMDRAGLTSSNLTQLRGLLNEAGTVIDNAQEQAFTAGHSGLVDAMEATRGLLQTIGARIDQNPAEARLRSEGWYRALLHNLNEGLRLIDGWRTAAPLTPEQLPPSLRQRFFAADGSMAIYAFPAKTVYDPTNLDQLIADVYRVSPDATGFPTTHQAFATSVVTSFRQGTLLAVMAGLAWLVVALRDVRAVVLASLPLLIGGGWMLGLMDGLGLAYNYANIVALPLVIALAVDYGVWFNYRWSELRDCPPLRISLIAGKVIALAAGTELAGLGAITLANYQGVASLGANLTIGLLCCLFATLLVAPAIAQLLDPRQPS